MKNVLVSGGTRGLGLAIVKRLLIEDYCVIATGRSRNDSLDKILADADGSGRLFFEPLDLAEPNNIGRRVAEITNAHGEIYGLLNNAAVGLDGVLATMHDSEIERTIQVNVTSTIMLTKYVSRSMLRQREGRIINIASVIAHTGFTGLSAYGATKAAMIGFTKSLARELGKIGITVNSISPGFMATDMTSEIEAEKLDRIRRRSALGRLVDVEDVSEAVAFLLDDSAAAITGTDLVVDAGSLS